MAWASSQLLLVAHLHPLPPRGDSVGISEVVQDALRRNLHPFALERGVRVARRLRGSLPDLLI